MEIDFYSEFEYIKTISVNKKLWDYILNIDALDKITEVEDIIPEGLDGSGESLERILLEDSNRNELIKGFAKILIKYSNNMRDDDNIFCIEKIIEIMKEINNIKITHLKLDI